MMVKLTFEEVALLFGLSSDSIDERVGSLFRNIGDMVD